MDIDIKPIEKNLNGYRGVERMLKTTHFKCKNKKMFEKLLEMYFDYISYTNVLVGIDTIGIYYKILPFYSLLIENGASCEIIVCNEEPIDSFCIETIEYLGIDIVNEYHESLLLMTTKDISNEFLNENLLCNNIDNCSQILYSLNDYIMSEFKCEMRPIYVYKIGC